MGLEAHCVTGRICQAALVIDPGERVPHFIELGYASGQEVRVPEGVAVESLLITSARPFPHSGLFDSISICNSYVGDLVISARGAGQLSKIDAFDHRAPTERVWMVEGATPHLEGDLVRPAADGLGIAQSDGSQCIARRH